MWWPEWFLKYMDRVINPDKRGKVEHAIGGTTKKGTIVVAMALVPEGQTLSRHKREALTASAAELTELFDQYDYIAEKSMSGDAA